MKRSLVSLAVALGIVVAFAPLAQATPAPTDPTASPDTIYPYVAGGRADCTTITFDSVYDTHLSVFDTDGVLVKQKNASVDSVNWCGEATGGGLVDPGTYQACIYFDLYDPNEPVEGWCAEVQVVHHDDYYWLQKGKKGTATKQVKVAGTCLIAEQSPATLVKCHPGSAAILRYSFKPPVLNSEQTFTGAVASSMNTLDYRNGASDFVTGPGVRVVTDNAYWGKVKRVFKSWQIHEEF